MRIQVGRVQVAGIDLLADDCGVQNHLRTCAEIAAVEISPDPLAADVGTLEPDRITSIDGLATFEKEQRRSGTVVGMQYRNHDPARVWEFIRHIPGKTVNPFGVDAKHQLD